jgi:tungstate transport system substrate-binding protein
MRALKRLLFVAVAVGLAGCARNPVPEPAVPEPVKDIRLATTTSTENTGLLAVLLPPFERRFGVKVSVIAVGTGKAIKLGQNGDVDLIFVHAREREHRFVELGFGVNRRDVMHNDFVIVGPTEDGAGIRDIKAAPQALARVAKTKSLFISRGDSSGTHIKEQALWGRAGLAPAGEGWYLEIGQGMAAALRAAHEKQAYTLTDRGTFIRFRKDLDLAILCQGDGFLYNPYGVIAVNPGRYPAVNYHGAMSLIAWLTSPAGQDIIRRFRMEGEPLFYPDAIPGKISKTP